jgi:hypothetical protein
VLAVAATAAAGFSFTASQTGNGQCAVVDGALTFACRADQTASSWHLRRSSRARVVVFSAAASSPPPLSDWADNVLVSSFVDGVLAWLPGCLPIAGVSGVTNAAAQTMQASDVVADAAAAAAAPPPEAIWGSGANAYFRINAN